MQPAVQYYFPEISDLQIKQFSKLEELYRFWNSRINVVSSVTDALSLSNVTRLRKRIEEEKDRYDFVISRAVTRFPVFASMTLKNIDERSHNDLPNGIIYLKGGDFQDELISFKDRVTVYNIAGFFDHPFFDTKKIIYLPAKFSEK